MKVHLAIDLGAGSGRIVAGIHEKGTLHLEEVHRFESKGVDVLGESHWNTLAIFEHILVGLRQAVRTYDKAITSIAVDSWGCDHALIDKNGNMLGGHRQYRDPRSNGMQEELDKRIAAQKVFESTGIQPMFFNSSIHLLAEKIANNPSIDITESILFTPDLLAFWLCGIRSNERTISSTSQLYNPLARDWAWDVIDAIGLPRHIFGKVTSSGTILGPLTEEIAAKIKATHPIQVVASAGHDTACAVAGLPMPRGSLWLSSGTWSILGVESEKPVTTPAAYAAGLANEGGVNKTIRLLQNVSGLWIIQQCRQHWKDQGEDISYERLAQLAEQAEPFTAFIDPNDASFSAPGDMPEKVISYCRKTGQKVPSDKGTILRIATESLALKYRQVVESLRKVTDREFDVLYAGGGGIQNELLMQCTANALSFNVQAGPVEATSCGNIITQMVATRDIENINEGRAVIAQSMKTTTYTPESPENWQVPYQTFLNIINQ